MTKEKKKINTYFIETICTNCGVSSKELRDAIKDIDYAIRIPRGTSVETFLVTATCLFVVV